VLTAGEANGQDSQNLPPGSTLWKGDELTVVELIQLGYSNYGEKPEENENRQHQPCETYRTPPYA